MLGITQLAGFLVLILLNPNDRNTMISEEQLRPLAKEVLEVQNASNFSGVAHLLVRVCQELRALGLGSSAIASHPIVIGVMDKLASLGGYPQAGLAQSDVVVRQSFIYLEGVAGDWG